MLLLCNNREVIIMHLYWNPQGIISVFDDLSVNHGANEIYVTTRI